MSNIKSFKETYSVIEEIGSGGQGTTFKCGDPSSEQSWVAVKVLHKQNDDERRSRLRRETVAVETLSHPNIPKLLDSNSEFWEDKNYKLFLATEFIHGSTLAAFDLSLLSWEQKLAMILKICEVVDYCHSRSIVHRDIKPDNIILRADVAEDPVLLDFGLSFNSEIDETDFKTPEDQHLGNRFMILPELKVGEEEKRDSKTDVTCLTGIFFYVLTGEQPTVLADGQERKPHQREKAKAVIDTFPQHQKDLINSIFDIGFNPSVEKRWQSVRALMGEINNLAQSKANPMETPEELLAYIHSVAERPASQDIRDTQELLGEASKKVLDAEKKIVAQLGKDWVGSMAVGGASGKYGGEGYDNQHAIANRLNGKVFYTYRKIFTTGNELVVISLVENARGEKFTQEVLRQPIAGEKNWDTMEKRLTRHYLHIIANELSS